MKIMMTLLLIAAPLMFAHSEEAGMLDIIKDGVVTQQSQKAEKMPPEIKTQSTKEPAKDKTISISVTHRDCMAQGNTYDECVTLEKNNPSALEKYDTNNPKIPTLSETTENLFINILIRH